MLSQVKPYGKLVALLSLLCTCLTVERLDAVGPPQNNTVYEIFVRSFYDSDGNGKGDLKGLRQKLDYLNDGNPQTDADLEIGIIWLMPIFPSVSYHGYNVNDYKAVQSATTGGAGGLRKAPKKGPYV